MSQTELAKVIPRRPRVSWWLGMALALGFAVLVVPAMTADRWLGALGAGHVTAKHPASLTVRVPPFRGYDTDDDRHIGGGGYLIARGEVATADHERDAAAIEAARPHGALPYVAFGVLAFVLAGIFTHHMRRSTHGRLVRVQIVSLVTIAVFAVLTKVLLLMTSVSVLVVPVALLALVPTLALDRVVGLASGVLAALCVALLGPFDVGVAILMLVQAAVAGLVVAERPKERLRAVLVAGGVTTVLTAGTYVLLTYFTTGRLPGLRDPLHSAWFAAALGPAIATVLAVPLLPLYQMLVGEITRNKLIELEDLSHPLLKQIAEKSPGTWQHSLMMANMAEIAANAIGANGRLVRVGAYYHDLGKSLQPKYFIENLEPGETSPHDQLPPEVSCDAIFAHVTEGIVTARKAGLHERIVDFMHMHHGNGVLEYFWGKAKEQGNPNGYTIEQFRYPGHPPQSRETAILAICDAVEAASRTLKKPTPEAIDSLVQRIVYGKLHLGQLDECGLSMADLRRISDSLRETIRHANHGRIEYPWQKAQQDASASKEAQDAVSTSPRLDSLDRSPARRDTTVKAQPASASSSGQTTTNEVALAATADIRGGEPAKPETLAKPEKSEPVAQRVTKPGIEPVRATLPERRKRSSAPPLPPAVTEPPIELVAKRPPTQPPPSPAEEAAIQELSQRIKLPTTPPPEGARKRAATLPPTPIRRPPTIQPPLASRRSGTIPPFDQSRTAGPPAPVELDNAVTNPPPVRHLPPVIASVSPHDAETHPAMKIDPEDLRDAVRTPPPDEDARRTLPSMPVAASEDAGTTAPMLPQFGAPAAKLPPRPPPKARTPGMAARIDAALESDEWGTETPIRAPTASELRALLGQPDPTRQQSLDEIERLQAAAKATDDEGPEILVRRGPMQTSEVTEDDIEAAIELVPPARRRSPSAIGMAKPKKPQ